MALNKNNLVSLCSICEGLSGLSGSCQIHGPSLVSADTEEMTISESKSPPLLRSPAFSHSRCPPNMHKSCFCVRFIAEHTKMQEDSTKVQIFYFIFSVDKCQYLILLNCKIFMVIWTSNEQFFLRILYFTFSTMF